MEQLIVDWGYWAVAIGCFFEGETVLLLGGLLAHKGVLRFPWVVLAAFGGSVSGDTLWFLLGRFAGQQWFHRWKHLKEQSARLEAWFVKRGTLFVFGFRFLYGIRSVAPAFLGASRYPIARFVTLNVSGALVWALAITALGWFLGATVQRLLGRAARLEEAALLAVSFVLLFSWWKRRRNRPTVAEQ